LYGIVDEWIQFYNPLRSSDVMDIVADGVGAATAIFVYRSWGLYRRILETRFWDVMRGRIGKEAGAE
jgi:VanZ family protein